MPPNKNNKEQPNQNNKAVSTPWYFLPFKGVEYLFYAGILLVLCEWLGPFWGWTVGEHAQAVFFAQLSLLQDDFPALTQYVINQILYIFEFAKGLTNIEFVGMFAPFAPYWEGLVFTTMALIARIIMLTSFYPIFVLALFVGVFDGLVVRQRRIAHLDREHATIHYHSKQILPGLFLLTGVGWLVVPGLWPVHPIWILLPGAVLVGVVARMIVASYKKYL
ncbi:DUF4400 domain-containing protein [Shewanella colwelliana]|uniref:DUF4400 domain-containing protein n=1 Tax=Shewanella colwelliana TaxID=23 RepID=UPI0037367CB9